MQLQGEGQGQNVMAGLQRISRRRPGAVTIPGQPTLAQWQEAAALEAVQCWFKSSGWDEGVRLVRVQHVASGDGRLVVGHSHYVSVRIPAVSHSRRMGSLKATG